MAKATSSRKSISCPMCDEKFDDKLASFAHLLTSHPIQYVNLKKAADRRKHIFGGFFDEKVKELEVAKNLRGRNHLKTIKVSLLSALKGESKAKKVTQASQANKPVTCAVIAQPTIDAAAKPAPSKTFLRCLNCTQKFSTPYEAVLHDLNSHLQVARFFCGKCSNGAAFTRARFLINHFVAVHPFDPFVCNRCHWSFGRDFFQYEQHLKTEYSAHLLSVYNEMYR